MKYKLILIFILIIAGSVLSIGIFTTFLIERIYIDASAERLEKEANLAIKIISQKTNWANNPDLLQDIGTEISNDLALRITIIDNKGTVLFDTNYNKNEMENHADRPEVKTALKGEKGKKVRYSQTFGSEMLYIALPMYNNNELIGVMRLAVPSYEIKTSISIFWNNLFLALIIIFIVTIIVSYRVSNKITMPIDHITKIAKKIMKKDYSERLEVKGNDEIAQLGKAINMMAEGLENQMKTIYQNEEKLTSVVNNMVSGVILVDAKGNIVLANPAVEWLLNQNLKKMLGKHHYTVGNQHSISELIEKVLTTGESIHTEIGIYQPSNKYLNCNVVPILDSDGQINGVLAVLHDITQIKHLENMRTEFIANVSHELRTPVTAVKGFTETLLDGALKDEETTKAFLQIIYAESDRLHRLINDLLDLSKIELNRDILKFSKIDLKLLIQSTIETMQPQLNKRNLIVIEELESVLAEVDPDRIKQVIMNLLTNAIAYTPENGKIILRLSKFKQKQVTMEIEDTGIGIPKNSLPRVFERFYRVDKARSRESGGTGLGLAIAKHIIESHGGIIKVESEVGKGTKFTILLPKNQHKY